MTDRLIAKASSIYDTFKKTNLPLFRHKNATVTSKSKQKIVSLNSDRCLYSDLYVACQSRVGDLENFFSHEKLSYPVLLSEYGVFKIYKAKLCATLCRCNNSGWCNFC